MYTRVYFADDFNWSCSTGCRNETERNANRVHRLLRRTNGCTFVILPEIRRPLLQQMLRVHFRRACMRVNRDRSERLCQGKVQQTEFHKIMTSIADRRKKCWNIHCERSIMS